MQQVAPIVSHATTEAHPLVESVPVASETLLFFNRLLAVFRNVPEQGIILIAPNFVQLNLDQ